MDNILNKKSGLLGVSNVSSDMRDIDAGILEGNERCELVKKMFIRRVIDYIAKYYVEMGGCDAIVFTAGIGEKSVTTRRRIVDGLKILGINLDEKANGIRGVEGKITTDDSKIPCYVIPTDEEVMIARDTLALIP